MTTTEVVNSQNFPLLLPLMPPYTDLEIFIRPGEKPFARVSLIAAEQPTVCADCQAA